MIIRFNEGVQLPLHPTTTTETIKGREIAIGKIKGNLITCNVSGIESTNTEVEFTINFTVLNAFCQLKKFFDFDDQKELDKVALESVTGNKIKVSLGKILYEKGISGDTVRYAIILNVDKGKIGGAGSVDILSGISNVGLHSTAKVNQGKKTNPGSKKSKNPVKKKTGK